MDIPYRFEPFSIRDDVDASELNGEEERFVELFEASRNDQGKEGGGDVNDTLDHLAETDMYAVRDEDDEIVGVAAIDINDGRVWLEGIAIDRYQRSLGLGKFVIDELVEIAKTHNCDRVSGFSQPNSRTTGFYLRCGAFIDKTIDTGSAEYVPMTISVAEYSKQ